MKSAVNFAPEMFEGVDAVTEQRFEEQMCPKSYLWQRGEHKLIAVGFAMDRVMWKSQYGLAEQPSMEAGGTGRGTPPTTACGEL